MPYILGQTSLNLSHRGISCWQQSNMIIGACWVHIRNRTGREKTSDEEVRELLGVPDGSPALAQVILYACSHNPKRRFSSASAMKNALLHAADGTNVGANDLNQTISVRHAQQVQDPNRTTSVRKAPQAQKPAQKQVDTFGGKKKSKVPAVIASILIVALLAGAGVFVLPKILDTGTEKNETTLGSLPNDNSSFVNSEPIAVVTEATVAESTYGEENNTSENSSQKANEYLLSSLSPIQSEGWPEWNAGKAEDPFGDDYSKKSNYAVFDSRGNMEFEHTYHTYYSTAEYRNIREANTISGSFVPYYTTAPGSYAYVQILADGVLKYTSPPVTRKTDPFTFDVNIEDSEYIVLRVVLANDGSDYWFAEYDYYSSIILYGVEPFQMLTVRIKIRRLVVVSFSERLDIAAVAISLNGCAFFNGGIHKLLYCRPLYIRHYSHFQELRAVLAVLRHANNHTLVSSSTAALALDFCPEVGVVQFNNTCKHILAFSVIHGFANMLSMSREEFQHLYVRESENSEADWQKARERLTEELERMDKAEEKAGKALDVLSKKMLGEEWMNQSCSLTKTEEGGEAVYNLTIRPKRLATNALDAVREYLDPEAAEEMEHDIKYMDNSAVKLKLTIEDGKITHASSKELEFELSLEYYKDKLSEIRFVDDRGRVTTVSFSNVDAVKFDKALMESIMKVCKEQTP